MNNYKDWTLEGLEELFKTKMIMKNQKCDELALLSKQVEEVSELIREKKNVKIYKPAHH